MSVRAEESCTVNWRTSYPTSIPFLQFVSRSLLSCIISIVHIMDSSRLLVGSAEAVVNSLIFYHFFS
jgi:hypothetical protein